MPNPWSEQWQDYFQVLGVKHSFTLEEVKRAYRKQALLHHPDKFADPEQKDAAHHRILIIQDAYRVLTDPSLLRDYLTESEERKVPLCHDPGCGRRTKESCTACGKPACPMHVLPPQSTGGLFPAPGRYCHGCLPRCSQCGIPCADPTPADLRGLEALRRAGSQQGPWCPECLVEMPPVACAQPGCCTAASEPCAQCGKPACKHHLASPFQTWGRSARLGHVCHACLPKCAHCGKPAEAPTSDRQRAAHAKLKAKTPNAEWCGACLDHAKVFECAGCGSGDNALSSLAPCPTCKKAGLCGTCLPEGAKEPCKVCARVAEAKGIMYWAEEVVAFPPVLAFLTPPGLALIGFVAWFRDFFQPWPSRGDEQCILLVFGFIALVPIIGIAGWVSLMIIRPTATNFNRARPVAKERTAQAIREIFARKGPELSRWDIFMIHAGFLFRAL